MPNITRRTFVQGVAALPLALGAMPLARAGAPYVRYDLASPQGRDMLAVLAGAVRRMQSYPNMTPLHWNWQWYTHFVRGDTTKADEIARLWGTSNTSMSRLAQETWDTCQSHSGQDPNNFLPWHRMFVYYFERIVRRVSGRADFTLPYWDYTSDDPAKRGVVPLEFRSPDDPVFGPLYRPDRTDLANSGQPIQTGSPGDPMRIGGPMGKAYYEQVGTDAGFCRAINSGIHGAIHVLVGNRDGMGTVPYSGNDPLFWVHHANIDRMWASWNLNGAANPVDAEWANQTFVFGDAGGRVVAPMRDFFDCAALGYGYDAYIPSPRAATTRTASTLALRAKKGKPERVARARDAALLGARAVKVPLLPVQATGGSDPVLGLDPNGARRTWLVLRDLHTWAQPEVLYHVYLTAPSGDRIDPDSYVGFIHFFDAEFHDHGHGAMGTALAQNYYSFDVTDLLARLARTGNASARHALAVTIVPGGKPTPGGKPLVNTIELIRE
ncbi:MAG: tyrosinase family protein [Lysobacteraceae bacterium]